ncbi:MAG: SurA N-terminal domain-containing protein [Bdellovibrionales bacterium]|nr:SurA N-terminal domain-containing protein [Bdellovibrionales bacterium]
MFNKIRKPGRAKGITAWVLFSAIILVFVFFGTNPGGGGIQKGGPAAIVNSKPISIAEFRQLYERFKEQMQFDVNQLPAQQRNQIEMSTRRRALETLISREVVAQAAMDKGLTVSSDELVDYIRNITAFQEDGQFRRELYMNYLNYIRKTPAEFEQALQRDIIVNDMQTLFNDGLLPVKGEAKYQAQLAETEVNFGVVRFSKEQLEESIPVSTKEITDYLTSTDGAQLAKSYYESNKAEFDIPEQVRARHILIMADPNDSKAVEEAKKKITTASERIKKEGFEKVAKDMSDDTQSAKKGGDLGYFGRGRMVPAFEEAAFQLEKGTISAPIQTQYGFHLIQVVDKKLAETKAFDTEKNHIAKKLIARSKVDQVISVLNGKLKAKDEKGVDQELHQLGFKWEETGDFSLSESMVPLIGSEDRIVTEAFHLTQKGQMPGEVLNSNGEYFLLKLKGLKIKDLSDVKEEDIEKQEVAINRRSNEVFNKWVSTQRDAAKIRRNEQLLIVQ